MRRAVITGIGPLTTLGIGREAFWQGLCAATSAVTRVTRFDPTPFRTHIAAEVRDFHPIDHLNEQQCKRLDRFAQFSVAAARLAMVDAGLASAELPRTRLGVSLGTALGGVGFAESQVEVYHAKGLRAVAPTLALSVFCGAGACNIAIDQRAAGPSSANANSCAAGTVALGDALLWIRANRADVVIAGGAEAPLSPLCFGAFSLIRAMSTRNDAPARACRPFDATRDGFVMAEGAAMLIVEEREHALARGAHVYAELTGYALTNDAHHMTAPHPTGESAAAAMTLALDDAGVPADAVGYINAHGSSTPLNDSTETLAIKRVFGDYATRVPVSSTKGALAHALGASGARLAV